MTNFGSDYPKPRLVKGKWLVPYAITSTTGDDGVVIYEAKEAASKTLFPHDLNAVIPSGNDADVLEAIKHGIRLQRAEAYPPIEDYLDGMVKSDQKQIDTYIADCLAVKQKYPFPDA
nr:hypothetical protein 7 [bacterium]